MRIYRAGSGSVVELPDEAVRALPLLPTVSSSPVGRLCATAATAIHQHFYQVVQLAMFGAMRATAQELADGDMWEPATRSRAWLVLDAYLLGLRGRANKNTSSHH